MWQQTALWLAIEPWAREGASQHANPQRRRRCLQQPGSDEADGSLHISDLHRIDRIDLCVVCR